MFARVETIAKASGIDLDFARVQRWPATVKAHTLVQNALERGTQRDLVRAIYDAYFMEGRDIGLDAVLIDLATRHGFDEAEARALLGDEVENEESRKEARTASGQGISGVPFFIFGDRFAVSGAQSVPVLVEAIRRAVTQSAAC
jgi:predicted DsbA family dithiol-disulfide isomerase